MVHMMRSSSSHLGLLKAPSFPLTSLDRCVTGIKEGRMEVCNISSSEFACVYPLVYHAHDLVNKQLILTYLPQNI